MSTPWHDYFDFDMNGLDFKDVDLTRTNAVFWMPENGEGERTVFTLGWGPYVVEVICGGDLEWYWFDHHDAITRPEDLEKFSMKTDRQIVDHEQTGELYRDHSPRFALRAESITGESRSIATYETLIAAFDHAHDVLTRWVEHSEEPPPF